ncbi:hypothetical protein ASG99_21490 [Bacillus sp. Soil768D1]|nr:hypothetical protein ASG99_21490 [Bacillus sp. Soil768D1]
MITKLKDKGIKIEFFIALTGALVLEGVEFPAPRKSAEKKDLRLKILFAACELNFPVSLNSDI